jgi:serine protease Do
MRKSLKYICCTLLIFCCGLFFFACNETDPANEYYQLAVDNGYSGTEEEWLQMLLSGGESAYDIAVDNGFVGTEQEWLASLVGSAGTDGSNGEDISASTLFELGVSVGEYTNDTAGYEEFLQDYLADIKAGSSTDIERVATKCSNQVVSIYTSDGAGSGVIYSINDDCAYIITNYHVIITSTTADNTTTYTPATDIYFYTFGAETFSVNTDGTFDYGSSYYKADYIGGSAVYDIAVLKVSGDYLTRLSSTDAEAITFADTTDIQVGSVAVAVGNALGEGLATTSGVVSVPSEYISVSIAGSDRILRCLRLDTAINSGNSGGGVFDIQGNLIGISNAKYSTSSIENIANAILASNVKNVAENIIYFYNQNLADDTVTDKTVGVHRYTIGYYYTMENPSNDYDETSFTNNFSCDITVESVVAGSIAESIGLQAGDVVTGLKFKSATSDTFTLVTFDMPYDINDFMLTVRGGDEVVLVVERAVSGETTKESLDLTAFTVDSSKFVVYKNNDVLN